MLQGEGLTLASTKGCSDSTGRAVFCKLIAGAVACDPVIKARVEVVITIITYLCKRIHVPGRLRGIPDLVKQHSRLIRTASALKRLPNLATTIQWASTSAQCG